jgi:phospho-N-acetylmuramoyl-pentapeptide-transferase
MFYYLFDYIEKQFHLAGASVFQYISFRAGMAAIISLIIATAIGKTLIEKLRKAQVGEAVRDLGLDGQLSKAGTPTMGGLILILAILLPTLLFAQLDNVYILLLILSVFWMGTIGFIDDYIKIFKKNKKGLQGRFKIFGQVTLGIIVASVMFFSDDVVIREYLNDAGQQVSFFQSTGYEDSRTLDTTIPFFKHNQLNYCTLFGMEVPWVCFIYFPIVVFIVTAVSNGVNITDGLDGLAAGTSAIVGMTLAILAYVSGNAIFADYLDIMYIPNSGELVVFCAAFVGACIGFLWFNSFPAQVFMGDTGSLMLGGVIATLALVLRKELLIPILCGIFLIENLSVILQVGWFKYTKNKYGEGRRIFLMAPLHHHYQKKNIHESKIVARFWISGILLAIMTLATLKLR